MPVIHAYIINIGTYRKLKMFWTKNSHPFVNGSSIINYQFISGKIKQKQFFLREIKLKQNCIFVFKIIPTSNIIVLNTLVVSLITTYVENQWPEVLSKRLPGILDFYILKSCMQMTALQCPCLATFWLRLYIMVSFSK